MVEKKYNLLRNLMYSSVSTLTTVLLFLLMSFAGNHLGAKEYGIFIFALDFAAIFEMFTDFGLRDISVRNVARDKSVLGKYLGNLIAWKILLSVAVFGVLVAAVNAMGYDAQTRMVVYLLAPSSFIKNLKYTVRLFFQVEDRFGWDTVLVVLERTLLLAVGMAVLFQWHALIPFVAAFTLVRAADLLLTLAVLHAKVAPIRLQLDIPFMGRLQWEAFPLGLFFVVFTVYSYIDTVMLSKMSTFTDVGLYNAAFKIYEGVTILPTVFWLVVLPRLSELFVHDRAAYRRLAERSVKAMVVVGIPTLAVGFLCSRWLIGIFFPDYSAAVVSLRILFLGILFQFPNWMLNAVLISAGRQKAILVLGTVGLAFKMFLNAWWIPIYGYNGSAVSTVIGESVIFLLTCTYIYRTVIQLNLVQTAVKPLWIGLLAAAVYFGLSRWSVSAGLFFAASIYFTGLLLSKTVDRAEWHALVSGMVAKIRPNGPSESSRR